MEFIKITDGVEIRKFQVSPKETTFQNLQAKIASLFTVPVTELSSIALRYRDSDGDIIMLSTDEEFQAMLSDLPKGHVCKLHIHILPTVALSSPFFKARICRCCTRDCTTTKEFVKGNMEVSSTGEKGVLSRPREATPEEEETATGVSSSRYCLVFGRSSCSLRTISKFGYS